MEQLQEIVWEYAESGERGVTAGSLLGLFGAHFWPGEGREARARSVWLSFMTSDPRLHGELREGLRLRLRPWPSRAGVQAELRAGPILHGGWQQEREGVIRGESRLALVQLGLDLVGTGGSVELWGSSELQNRLWAQFQRCHPDYCVGLYVHVDFAVAAEPA